MGVLGLWELLAPVGRRVSVETLTGKRLAIDASIWIIQFMTAMRDEKGDMVRNAHLLGFFRRICKLLYLRTKPVFVFDGGTPALKKRTVLARRHQRENARSRLRKNAEKLLLNHLRTRKLEEIAQNIGISQGAKSEGIGMDPGIHDDGNGDFMQSSHIDQETTTLQELNVVTGSASPASGYDENSEKLNTSQNVPVDESGGSDEDNECIFLPPAQGHVDPAVLASLPPSMQLDLLVQMREQLVADNRKKFQEVAKNPGPFSQMQIQAYLKTVAFRRDINEVQKAAAGKGIGGIPSARIASEANREYIFSTTFDLESQKNEINRDVSAHVSEDNQEHIVSSKGIQSVEMFPIKFKPTALDEDVILQRLSDKVSNEDSLSDDAVEWEEEDTTLCVGNQPVRGVTVQIDEADLVSDGVNLQKLFADVDHNISEDNDIEWENGILERDGKDVANEEVIEVMVPVGNDTEVELQDGRMHVASKRILSDTKREIEAAELQEAIRRSLEDYGTVRNSKLIIKDASCMEHKQSQVSTVLPTCAPDSEEVFLVLEKQRKGKAVLEIEQTVEKETMQDQAFLVESETRAPLSSMEGMHGENRECVATSNISSFSQQAFPSAAVYETLDNRFDGVDISTCTVETTGTSKTSGVHESMGSLSLTTIQELSVGQDVNGLEISQNHGQHDSTIQPSRPCFSDPAMPSPHEAFQNVISEAILLKSVKLDPHGDSPLDKDVRPQTISWHGQTNDTRMAESCSSIGLHYAVETHLEDAFLGEAEELDLLKEREALAENERNLLAEKLKLRIQQEAEQADIKANLQDERDRLLQEEIELRASQQKNKRNADTVTGEMFSDCQELLQMFGLPYIIAPMEAEAQCAFMNSMELVDGVVTEDCDVFLFGGRNVFKNIFDDRKYVETYYMKDVESELGLDRKKLIHMALLLGSDYTEGVSGIGIVNAIEVVNAFEGDVGLQKFREWLDAPDYTLLNKVNGDGMTKQTKKKSTKGSKVNEVTDDVDNERSGTPKFNLRQQDFIDKHRAVSKNWSIPESFPNPIVINAYLSPQVDKSTESFAWGRPDLEALRSLCFEKFGWNRNKSDELLIPVLKEYDRHETQLRLEAFYSFNQRFAKIRSKRIQKAVTRITGRVSSELMDIPVAVDHMSEKEKKAKKRKSKNDSSRPQNASSGESEEVLELQELHSDANKEIRKRGQGTGRCSRGRGRGRGRGVLASKSGSRNKIVGKNNSESSISAESSSDELQEQSQNSCELSGELRRSNRLSKRAVYTFSGSKDEDTTIKTGDEEMPEGEDEHAMKHLPGEAEEHTRPLTNENADAEFDEKQGHTNHQVMVSLATEDSIGFQEQGEMSYLYTGGGFCNSDAEIDREEGCDLVEMISGNDQGKGDGLVQMMPGENGQEEGLCGISAAKPETVGQRDVHEGEVRGLNASYSADDKNLKDAPVRLEPRFRAVPALKRKRQRTK